MAPGVPPPGGQVQLPPGVSHSNLQQCKHSNSKVSHSHSSPLAMPSTLLLQPLLLHQQTQASTPATGWTQPLALLWNTRFTWRLARKTATGSLSTQELHCMCLTRC